MEENEKSREYLKKEIEKYKYIRYKNVHVNPTVEIKPDMDINKLNSYVKNTIISLHKSISNDKRVNDPFPDIIKDIYNYRCKLEQKIKLNN